MPSVTDILGLSQCHAEREMLHQQSLAYGMGRRYVCLLCLCAYGYLGVEFWDTTLLCLELKVVLYIVCSQTYESWLKAIQDVCFTAS